MRYLNNDLILSEVEAPSPKAQEIQVHVSAIGVNPADLLQRKGKYPPPPGASEILGLEVAGTVESLGPHATQFQKGDRVMCLLPGGGYAEKVCVRESHCIPIPHNLSFEEGAAIPEVFLTAYQALFLIGELLPGQWVLIHAATGGVGTAAIQLASASDAKTIGTTRSKDKLEKCLALGVDAMINTYDGHFAKKVLETTEDHGVDLILDFVGAPYYMENIQALSKGGALLILSTQGGNILEKVDLRLLMQKWITLSATTLRSRPQEYKDRLVKEFSHFALSRFESGRIKPVLHQVLPWTQAEEAHSLLAKGTAFGKIILSIA